MASISSVMKAVAKVVLLNICHKTPQKAKIILFLHVEEEEMFINAYMRNTSLKNYYTTT